MLELFFAVLVEIFAGTFFFAHLHLDFEPKKRVAGKIG